MAKQSLLVADADPRSLRILDVALRKAGFQVGTASDGAEALRRLQRDVPDLLIADANLPGLDGLSLCRAVCADERMGGVPVIVISADKDPGAQKAAVEAGAEDFLSKPLLIKELTQRIRMLLVRREQEKLAQRGGTPAALMGAIGDLGLVDVFQSLDGWKRSAVVSCEWGGKTATVWVRDGQVVDCETGSLSGEAAFYRLLNWEGGNFQVDFGPVDRESVIEVGTQGLVMEAMRRVDEMGRLSEELPLSTRLTVDFAVLAKRLADLPDEVNGVLRLIDGSRSLTEVLERSSIDDLATLVVVQRLLGEKVLLRGEESARPRVKPSLSQWLGPASVVTPDYSGTDAHGQPVEPQLPLKQAVESPAAAAVVNVDPQASPTAVTAPGVHLGALAGPTVDSPQASFDLPVELARMLTPPQAVSPVAAMSPAPPVAAVEAAALQVAATFAHADVQAVLAAKEEARPEVKTETFKLPAEPKRPAQLIRFPPLRGVRRERLRREADEARQQLAAGKPVRLTHLVELPAWPVSAGEAVRRISPAVSEAAKKFAPDLPVAAVSQIAKARAEVNGQRAPAAPAEGMVGTDALLGQLPVPSLRIPDTEPAPPPAFTPAPAPEATPAAALSGEQTFESKPLTSQQLGLAPAPAGPALAVAVAQPDAGAIRAREPGSLWEESTDPGADDSADQPTSPGHQLAAAGETSPDAPTSPGHYIEPAEEKHEETAAKHQSLALLEGLVPAAPAQTAPAALAHEAPAPAPDPAPAPAPESEAHAAAAATSPVPPETPVLAKVPQSSPGKPRPISGSQQAPARKTDAEFDAEINAALGRGQRRWPLYAGLAAAVVVALFFVLRPQPITVNKGLLGNLEADKGTKGAAPVAVAVPGLQPATTPAADAGAAAVPASDAGLPADAGAVAAAEPVKAAEPAAVDAGAVAAVDAGAEPAKPAEAAPPADDYARALAEGEALLKRGKYKLAVTALKKAVSFNPESVPALLELGDAFLEADQPKNALKPLEKAAKLDPRNGRSQLLLGTAWQSLGKNQDATKAYKRYLELEPTGEYARDVRSILANLQH